jgi:hypothetical protein
MDFRRSKYAPFGLAVVCCAIAEFLFGMAHPLLPTLAGTQTTLSAEIHYLPAQVPYVISGNHIVISERHDATGIVTHQEWLKDGKYDRADSPAIITRDRDTGAVSGETWYTNGKVNRANGPANIQYNTRGKVLEEDWYRDGKQDRADGPALIVHNTFGGISCDEWWKDGTQIDPPIPDARAVDSHHNCDLP